MLTIIIIVSYQNVIIASQNILSLCTMETALTGIETMNIVDVYYTHCVFVGLVYKFECLPTL